MSPPLSTPCPRIVQLQCAHLGAIAWAAHSKLSNAPLSYPRVRVNVLSYSLPQVSHTAMAMAPISDGVGARRHERRVRYGRPRRGSLLGLSLHRSPATMRPEIAPGGPLGRRAVRCPLPPPGADWCTAVAERRAERRRAIANHSPPAPMRM